MDSGPASWRRGLPNTAGSLRTGQLTAPFLRSAVRGRARPGVQARACAHSSAASLSRVPVLWPLAGPCRAGTKRLRVPPEQERPRFARLRVTWARGEGERRGGGGGARTGAGFHAKRGLWASPEAEGPPRTMPTCPGGQGTGEGQAWEAKVPEMERALKSRPWVASCHPWEPPATQVGAGCS